MAKRQIYRMTWLAFGLWVFCMGSALLAQYRGDFPPELQHRSGSDRSVDPTANPFIRSTPTKPEKEQDAAGSVKVPSVPGYGAGTVPGASGGRSSVTPNSVLTMPNGGLGVSVPTGPGTSPSAGAGLPSTRPVQAMPLLNPYPQPQPRASTGAAVYGQHNPVYPNSKPFADFKQPSPISPYMNLYRRDHVPGVDNYNMYVKPAIEAQQQAQAMQQEVRDIEIRQAEQKRAEASAGMPQVGATYGKMNTGVGATYGFQPTPAMAPAPVNVDVRVPSDKNKAAGESEENEDDEIGTVRINLLNPYLPAGSGTGEKKKVIP